MDIKELLNEYEALEVNADELKKEIEDAKAEKVKMADGHKKYWKEIKGKKLGESLNEGYKNFQRTLDDYDGSVMTITANNGYWVIAEISGCEGKTDKELDELADEVLTEKGLIKGDYFTAETDEEADKNICESLNEELKYANKVEKLKEKGFSINRLSDSSIEISKEGKSGQEIYDELKEIGLEGNKINPSNVILENYTGIEIPADYKERLAKGTEYLEKYVATVDPEYYEIVEDNYEYPFGLLIIEYEDKEHEVEIGHTCINLYSPNYPNWDLDDEGHIIDESVNEAEKKYLTKEELLAKVKEGILPDEYVPSDIGQGMGYKINLRWEEVPTDDIVIYIPEYGYGMWDEPNNGMPKEDSIYTKADFREITKELGKRAEEEAEYLFQAVDWQYPESLWDEMEFDDEMDESISLAKRALTKFSGIREDYDKSTFNFCINTGDIKLLDKMIDEKIAEYDKADKEERHEIELAVEDMLNKIAASSVSIISDGDFNRLYDKLAALEDRIIEDNTIAWEQEEKEQKARFLASCKSVNEDLSGIVKNLNHYYGKDAVDAFIGDIISFKPEFYAEGTTGTILSTLYDDKGDIKGFKVKFDNGKEEDVELKAVSGLIKDHYEDAYIKEEKIDEFSPETIEKVSIERKRNSNKAHDEFRHKDDEITAEKMDIFRKNIYYPDSVKEIEEKDKQNGWTNTLKELSKKATEADKKLERNKELVAKRNARLNKTEKDESLEEEKREVLPIKFIGVDEWNRPAFKPEGKKYYLTDVNNLFSEGATEEEVKKFYADAVEKGTALRDLITYHGYSLDDDPMGSKLKFDLEIV